MADENYGARVATPALPLIASWQRSSCRLWQRYSDTELVVILDFLADTAEQLRKRTETMSYRSIGDSS